MFFILDREMQKIMKALPHEIANRFLVGFLMFVIGGLMFALALGYAVPADLFSTALWFDKQGMPLVFEVKFYLWDLLGEGKPTSIEGAVFSLIITLMTWSFAFKAMRAVSTSDGNYGGGQRNPLLLLWGLARGSITASAINWDICSPLLKMTILVLFDVLTGAGFRAGGNANWVTSFLVAFLFENVLSDNALIAGFQMSLSGGLVLFQLWESRGRGFAQSVEREHPTTSPQPTPSPSPSPTRDQRPPSTLRQSGAISRLPARREE